MRLDKWLWAARFFRTRALAADAIVSGKVVVNDHAAKRAKEIRVGDRIRLRRGPHEVHLTVLGLTPRRGPPSEAALLYAEDAASIQAREKRTAELRLLPSSAYRGKGRPTKKARRDLLRWKARS